jgi:ribonuclease HII
MRPPRHKTQADFSFEHALIARGITPICGVDEAGRGPLAGPVVASAVILTHPNLVGRIPDGLNDSKALSQDTRERLLNEIMSHCYVGIGIAEPEEIDRVNILQASLNAMARAVAALPVKTGHALIDGTREAPLSCPQTTIVKGDARSLSIAAASIVAKVTRDWLMVEAERRYPGYGFAQHKGYPTKAHRDAVAKIGPCPIHRRSFAPIRDYCDIIDAAHRDYRARV